MPTGWGVGSEQAPLPPEPVGDLMGRLVAAVEAIRDRFVIPERRFRKSITLTAAGASDFLDTEKSPIRMLTVQVYTGILDIWLQDQRGGSALGNPDFSVPVLGVPVHIPLATMPYQITFFANGGACTACVNATTPD